jgi:hypothetical protein
MQTPALPIVTVGAPVTARSLPTAVRGRDGRAEGKVSK